MQLPSVLRLLGGVGRDAFWLSLGRGNPHAAEVVRNFLPVVTGRGVVQLSAYLDGLIASLLPTGSVAALLYAQTIYMLPISLFGMSISAAALPTMSAEQGAGGTQALEALRSARARPARDRLSGDPLGGGDVDPGDVYCAALFRTGRSAPISDLRRGDPRRLHHRPARRHPGAAYSSAYYALKDTRTPLRFATLRVLATGALGLSADSGSRARSTSIPSWVQWG